MSDNKYIEALELEKAGDWEGAHRIVGAINTPEAAWVHAYLHRVEGDLGNAGYWYRNAGRPECRDPLADEWQAIYDALS